jgi:hypothetical protein
MPGIVPQVEDSIESLEIVIRGLGYLESAEAGFEETKDLQARLQAAGDDPQKVLQVQKEYDALQKKVLGPDEQLQKFRTFFESAAPLLNPKDRSREDKLSCIRSKLDELEGQLQDQESPEQPSENALFDMVFGAIGKAGQKGEVDSERETTLRRVLEEFQRIYNRPDGTPEQMALKSREMRELIQRYKNIFLNPQIGNKKDS